VHSHIYSWPTLRYGGVPKLLTLHSWGKIGRHGRGRMNNILHEGVLQPLSLATAAGVVSVSRQIGALVGKSCAYVPNPIAPAFFAPRKTVKSSSKEAVQLVLSGAVSPLKRTADALDILAKVRKVYPATHLKVVGGYSPQSAYFKYLQKKQMALGLQHHVEWAGLLSTPELLKALDASHIGLSVSGSETFGLAPLEMLARCMPVVATRVGVMDWDGKALQKLGARIVEVNDTSAAAEEILKLMKKGSPERLPEATPKALQKAYGLEAFMETYRQRYQEILA
jgi:glycosyltransferase involved in cell wall biosynthesis